MKLLVAVVASAFLVCPLYSQVPITTAQVVRRIIESGALDGHDSKLLAGTGDAVAVAATKALGGRDLGPGEIDPVLAILGEAFAAPESVRNVPDREPRTALLLLRYFDHWARDPQLKGRIDQTRRYIQDRCGLVPSEYPHAGNDPKQVIRRIVESGVIEGHDSKVLAGIGDAAAVAATKALADRPLGAREINGVLWVLGQAFVAPESVKNTSDREPKTARLLLRYFDLSTSDPGLKGKDRI